MEKQKHYALDTLWGAGGGHYIAALFSTFNFEGEMFICRVQ
jgi:hypothetical protein